MKIVEKAINSHKSEDYTENNRQEGNEGIDLLLYSEQKHVLKEGALRAKNKENHAIYKIVSREYNKLQRRCPLYKQEVKRMLKSEFNSFVKLELASDNLGRYMRLKEMKHPLKNYSVIKGLSYMRHFFLKKMLTRNLIRSFNHEYTKSQFVLVPDVYSQKILTALMDSERIKLGSDNKRNTMTKQDLQMYARGFSSISFISQDRVATSHISLSETTKKKSDAIFEAEIIRVDHSVFGELEVAEDALVFVNAKKDTSKSDYLYGPSSEVSVRTMKKDKKVWLYDDIKEIVIRRYNLIRQAVEIFLKNRKSIFLVLFSKEKAAEFITSVTKMSSSGNKIFDSVECITDLKAQFNSNKYTEKWRKKEISNFEYLMKLNYFGARSFQDLSQYPVFPWALADYSSKELIFDKNTDFRDFKRSMAAISDKKINEGDNKYENTDDFPDGRFQFGSHYMPGRVVLSYLMRMQPYTLMIDIFDAGGDSAARHFHVLESWWNSMFTDIDNNYELIPEFYYNPEILVNQYTNNTHFVATSTHSEGN